MERFETEEQQIEAIKRFWKENGLIIGLGVVLGFGGLWGWRAYNDNLVSVKESASSSYVSAIEDFVETENVDALSQFVSKNSETGYAPLAALIVAQRAVEDEDFDTAKSKLSIAAQSGNEIADLAKLRLAKVHAQIGEYDQALAQLSAVSANAYDDQVNELKGDVLYLKGDFDQARDAYSKALVDLPNDPNIKMKLDNTAHAKTLAASTISEQ